MNRRETLAAIAGTTLLAGPRPLRAGMRHGGTDVMVRKAGTGDVPVMVELVEQRRAVYQRFEPVFWRKAEDSATKTMSFFTSQLTNPRATVLVAEAQGRVTGFLIAVETAEPTVYAPGGPTILVDDFCVADPSLWSVAGRALLDEVRRAGKAAGWRQIVVVNAWRDEPKARLLRDWNLSLASTWWTTTL